MHDAHWMKNSNQVLLPATSVGALASGAARRNWRAIAALLSCAAIFVIDMVVPGVVVGLLYGVVVLAVARLGGAAWPLAVCALGTVLHAVAGLFDVAAVDPGIAAANRVLAILALWAVGGAVAYHIATRASSTRAGWTAISID